MTDELFADLEVEPVSLISSALFTEMNEVVGQVKSESVEDALSGVKLKPDEESHKENKDGLVKLVCTSSQPPLQIIILASIMYFLMQLQ